MHQSAHDYLLEASPDHLSPADVDSIRTHTLHNPCPWCHSPQGVQLHPPSTPWYARPNAKEPVQQMPACWWVHCVHCGTAGTALWFRDVIRPHAPYRHLDQANLRVIDHALHEIGVTL